MNRKRFYTTRTVETLASLEGSMDDLAAEGYTIETVFPWGHQIVVVAWIEEWKHQLKKRR